MLRFFHLLMFFSFGSLLVCRFLLFTLSSLLCFSSVFLPCLLFLFAPLLFFRYLFLSISFSHCIVLHYLFLSLLFFCSPSSVLLSAIPRILIYSFVFSLFALQFFFFFFPPPQSPPKPPAAACPPGGTHGNWQTCRDQRKKLLPPPIT